MACDSHWRLLAWPDVVSALHVHVVFITKYRRGVLRSEHLDLLEAVFANVCSDFGATLVESKGTTTSTLLVEYPPTVATSALVNSLKGVSSLRQRFEMRTHRDHLWSPSHFATSAGAPLSIIRQYVEAQRRPA